MLLIETPPSWEGLVPRLKKPPRPRTAPRQAMTCCRMALPGQSLTKSAELGALAPHCLQETFQHTCTLAKPVLGYCPVTAALRRLGHRQDLGTKPSSKVLLLHPSCAASLKRRMRPSRTLCRNLRPCLRRGRSVDFSSVALVFSSSKTGREPAGSLAAPGAGDGAGRSSSLLRNSSPASCLTGRAPASPSRWWGYFHTVGVFPGFTDVCKLQRRN